MDFLDYICDVVEGPVESWSSISAPAQGRNLGHKISNNFSAGLQKSLFFNVTERRVKLGLAVHESAM